MIQFRHGQSIKSDTDIHYRFLQYLGRGKNATVLLVTPSSGQHRGLLFALKIFERIESEESRRRFFKEAAFLQTCSHPAVMRIYDTGSFDISYDSRPFVIAEYFPQTLEDVIGAGTASIPQKLSYALDRKSVV